MKLQQGSLLTSRDFRKMITIAGRFIERNKDILNRLNVFPVPDGDTGTNLSLTIAAAAAACDTYRGTSVGELAARVASQALMGAQGNSGVIFSQLLRGLAHGLRHQTAAGPSCLSRAWQSGVTYAYKAVARPVEGTILTVARRAADGAYRAVLEGAGIAGVLEGALREAREALERTREMLPALREAGLVDAGGTGLVIFLQGCLFALRAAPAEWTAEKGDGWADPLPEHAATAPAHLHLEYPYCTELLIDWPAGEGDVAELKRLLSGQGDSLLLVNQGGLVKVHLHTDDPGGVISTCAYFGAVSEVKVEHMPDQSASQNAAPARAPRSVAAAAPPVFVPLPKENGLIAVASGEGLKNLFLSLGADAVVPGGPGLNTPVADLLAAVNRAPHPGVLILANNRNILPAARQVKAISGKEVAAPLIYSIPQGLAALVAFRPAATLAENVQEMEAAAQKIRSGEIAAAVRDTVVDRISVKKGDYLGLLGGKAVCTADNLAGAVPALLEQMVEKDHEILTLIYGREVPPPAAASAAEQAAAAYPHLTVELKDGGQPVYCYYLYLE